VTGTAGLLRSGELADAAGVNPQTLRYHERRGLLTEPRRSPGGHRLYPPDSLTLLRVIKTAQRLGPAGRAAAKLTEVQTRIADLQVIAATLRSAIDAGCDDLTACATSSCCPLPFADLDRGETL